MALWKQIETVGVEKYPYFLDPSDECYFARDFVKGGGPKSCEANQLIFNFKKTPDRKGRPEWFYKEQAIKRFANELASLVPDNKDITAIAIPTSKTKTDPLYDNRFEQVLDLLAMLRPNINIQCPLSLKASHEGLHSGSPRNPTKSYESFRWDGFGVITKCLVIIDDVITCGTNFKACQRHVLENHPEQYMVGVFWAKTVWPDPPPAEEH